MGGFDELQEWAQGYIGTRGGEQEYDSGFVSFWDESLPLVGGSGVLQHEPKFFGNSQHRIGYINSPCQVMGVKVDSTKVSGKFANGEPHVIDLPTVNVMIKLRTLCNAEDMELLRLLENRKRAWFAPHNMMSIDGLINSSIPITGGYKYGIMYPYPFYTNLTTQDAPTVWRYAAQTTALLGTFYKLKVKMNSPNAQDANAFDVEISFSSAVNSARLKQPYEYQQILL